MRPVVLFAPPLLLLMLSFLVESRGAVDLPYAKVFKGESEFERGVSKSGERKLAFVAAGRTNGRSRQSSFGNSVRELYVGNR